MNPYFDDDLRLRGPGVAVPRGLELQRSRCRKAAKVLFAVGALGVAFLCLWGLKPAPLTIPVFFAATSLLFAAASAALFARVASLHLENADPDVEDDDGRWPGGGWDEPPEPPGGGDMEFDWVRFEREFRAYCERISPAQLS